MAAQTETYSRYQEASAFYSRCVVAGHLPNPGLEEQVGVALEANARLEEALKRVALPVETVDDLSS